jgi:hypothetical protein
VEHFGGENGPSAASETLKKNALPKQCRVNGSNAPGGTRTPNLLIRSQMLYPIELRAPIPTFVLLGERAIESSTRSRILLSTV